MRISNMLLAVALLGLATSEAAANGRSLSATAAAAPATATSAPTPPAQAAAEAIRAIATSPGTTTVYPVGGKEGKDLPRIVAPTLKFAFKDDVGAFQGWNGGLELPKVIDLGGVRTTRSGLRGRKLSATAAAAPATATSAPTPPAQAAAEAIRAIATSPGTTTVYPVGGKEGKDLPRIVAPTFKFAFKDDVGAFQGWNGGLELPKVIDLGGVRTTRSGLRGKKMQ